MGCLNSKKEPSETHANVFRVVHVGESGEHLTPAKLEINDSDIILYRGSQNRIVWPLHSLRRYGFQGELFSFESGRRCETGPGIYGFKCRQAAELFSILQQQIQMRNLMHESVLYPVSRLSPSPQGRQTLQASVVHRSSIDNGFPITISTIQNGHPNSGPLTIERPVPQSPRSSSSADILEVMPLYPRQQTNSIVTNVYQVAGFKREHNNNHSERISSAFTHVYSNELNRDLAKLRNTLREEAALSTIRDIEDETRFLESRYINNFNSDQSPILSPTLSNSSEHYAQLSMDHMEQTGRLYANIVPEKLIVKPDDKIEPQPTTPLTPKQADYCNLSIGIGSKPELNTYANLSLGDTAESLKSSKFVFNTTAEHKLSESDTVTSMSPVEDLEVNYAVLDIDSTKDTFKAPRDVLSPESHSNKSCINESTVPYGAQCRVRLVSQNSVEKPVAVSGGSAAPAPNVGYTTIDFDKTVALTSVAAGADVDSDGARKTRHNNNSPSNSDKSKTVSN